MSVCGSNCSLSEVHGLNARILESDSQVSTKVTDPNGVSQVGTKLMFVGMYCITVFRKQAVRSNNQFVKDHFKEELVCHRECKVDFILFVIINVLVRVIGHNSNTHCI